MRCLVFIGLKAAFKKLKLKIVEDDIVKLRQTTETNGANGQTEKISVEDLHLLLVEAR